MPRDPLRPYQPRHRKWSIWMDIATVMSVGLGLTIILLVLAFLFS